MQRYFDLALDIAVLAHKGQVDKGGEPYIMHVLRVMMGVESIDEKVVALLHDVVEDSDISLMDLKNQNFPSEILKAVDLLTKKENSAYSDYILEIKNNPLAKAVKLSDLRDNMDTNRLTAIDESDKLRVKKYKEAYELLCQHN